MALAALAVAAGCSPKIGDKCTVSTDCSATGDRLCDITEPGGYCTVFNCEPDSCPDDSACVNFGSTLSSLVTGPASKPLPDPACAPSQGNSPYQRSFCMAGCGSDADCRGGYKCLAPDTVGGVEVDNSRSTQVCAVPRTGSVPVLGSSDAGPSDGVCLGSDAGLVPESSGGGAGSGGAAGTGGQSSGGASGADNADAGG